MAAGYSHRSAAEKVGVRAGSRLGLIDADEGWNLDGMPEDVMVRTSLRGGRDVTIAFVRSRRHLQRNAQRYERSLEDTAALWIAWPRRTSGHGSDVTENLLREVFLPLGLVDVKVVAIDHDWSGLKFVRRKQLRTP
jgi:hypothetical protein